MAAPEWVDQARVPAAASDLDKVRDDL